MAKIRLKDYLKKKRKREEVLFESEEDIIRRVKDRLSGDAYIVYPAYRIENYTKCEDLLSQIPKYPGTKELREEIAAKKLAAQEEKKAFDLALAHHHLEIAETENEYEKVRKEFTALGTYGDAAECAKLAKKKTASFQKASTRRTIIRLIVLVLIAAACVGFFTSGLFGYTAARLEGLAGEYVSARNRFRSMGNFLDAKKQAAYYDEKYLLQREQQEQTSLRSAEVGDTVDFGEYSWVILEKYDTVQAAMLQDETSDPEAKSDPVSESEMDGSETDSSGILLLGLKTASSKGVFGPRAYNARKEDVTWETSDLREYLNTKVLKEFADAEIAAMVPMEFDPGSNEKYRTDGGAVTTDLIRILSAEEARAYKKSGIYTSPGTDCWLATPGHAEDTACFLTQNGKVMDYGDSVTDNALSVGAVICVDYTKLRQ